MSKHDYDVVVVGGRVAGGSLALRLGERGHRVLLIDRDRFPSDTLSTHYMSPRHVPLLAKLGVLADVEALGFRRITRNRCSFEDCSIEGPLAPNGGYALAPRRDALDQVIVEHATRRGNVKFHDRTVVEGLLRDGERVIGVTLRGKGGERVEARAKVVVGADGKYSSVAEWVSAPKYHEVSALRPAYYGHFRGVAPLPETCVELFFQRNAIGFLFPMRPGEDCLALEIQPEHWEAFREDPQATFRQWFQALPGMASRLANAQLDGKLLGVRGVENYFRKPYGMGWALTGDAAYCKDPSTGFGIGDALSQAFWLADALHAALEGADWEETMAAYQRQRDEALLPWYHATLGFTRAPDASAEAIAWLRAVCSSAGFIRGFVPGIPAALADPKIFPAAAYSRLAQLAAAFGASGRVPD
ncbi:MAG TPA: FAD-dependent monooxygenase [Chloroflexota bacterium]|nr:FAD-dependent monooxygenase [Chloroflexota bacterium]